MVGYALSVALGVVERVVVEVVNWKLHGCLSRMRGTTSAGPRRETAEVSTDPPIGIAGASDSLFSITPIMHLL
jgi:hypothetical protein